MKLFQLGEVHEKKNKNNGQKQKVLHFLLGRLQL